MNEYLDAAREILRDSTPLNVNCGAYCGAACCQSGEDRALGVHLFPGEEEYYALADLTRIEMSDWWIDGRRVPMLICAGENSCPRENRPLACRIFPLTPVRDGVKMDCRAYDLCPLAEQGMRALREGFVRDVERAMEVVRKDAGLAYFVKRWVMEEEQYRRL